MHTLSTSTSTPGPTGTPTRRSACRAALLNSTARTAWTGTGGYAMVIYLLTVGITYVPLDKVAEALAQP